MLYTAQGMDDGLRALQALYDLRDLRALHAARDTRRAISKARNRKRGPRPERTQPLTWEEFLDKPILRSHTKYFGRLFRMDRTNFDYLATLLHDREKATTRRGKHGGQIGATRVCDLEAELAMTLRYLAGGAIIDQCVIWNVTLPTLYRILKRTLEALHAVLPPFELREALSERETSTARLDTISAGFGARSAGLLPGVIGAIDGLLVPIKRPGTVNERCFYCRKGFYAMNVQAIADVHGCILHASVGLTPGAVHDSFAWSQDPLSKNLREGPIADWLKLHKRYLIGDDAYPASHTLVVPWPGKYALDSPELAFNERHSSARISVECAFGMLCRKWLFLKRPFELGLKRSTYSAGFQVAVVVAMKLHNLAIKKGSALSADVLDKDVSGEMEEGAKERPRRPDYRSRPQPVDPDMAHLSSPNPRLARAEREAGDAAAANAAAGPAWYTDRLISPRAPEFGEVSAECEPREMATELLRDPREEVTQLMRAYGIVRQARKHW